MPLRCGASRAAGSVGCMAVITVCVAACSGSQRRTADTSRLAPSIVLTSAAFRGGDSLPATFTCDGANHSPPLAWSGTPARTQSLTVIVDDPDAPGGAFVHWLLYDLPGTATSLPEGVPQTATVPQLGGARQGQNDFHRAPGYDGPCPPRGAAHRYRFWMFALDTILAVGPGAPRTVVESAMRGHELAYAELVTHYARR